MALDVPAQLKALCAEAEADYAGYWARLARENVVWNKPFTKILDESNAPFYKWFEDGELNASANCLDKHIGTPVENKTAIIFEADDGAVTKVTYKELLARVSQFANALKAQGIKKGDRVIIYMPMTIDGVVAMQACARIGATHSVVFGGFSAQSLRDRIEDAGAVAVITADEQLRGGKKRRIVAVEPAACPSLTRGKYAYDFGDTGHMTPLTKMHTLGSTFTPPGFHAGGLRYHGMSPLVSASLRDGLMEAQAIHQSECFDAGILFAKTEGIIPAPESTHAIAATIREALKAKEEGNLAELGAEGACTGVSAATGRGSTAAVRMSSAETTWPKDPLPMLSTTR